MIISQLCLLKSALSTYSGTRYPPVTSVADRNFFKQS